MKFFQQSLFLIGSLFSCLFVSAQSGVLTGVVTDAELGESLISAYIKVVDTDYMAATDFDGKYSFDLPVGTYSIVISYIGYADKKVTDIIIKDDETTYMDVNMAADAEQLEEVVISAKIIERSENSVLLLQKKSIKIQDGISAQQLAQQAVGNVAGAMKKITGATVQDGKYLNVRGLGDRYSLAQLDGVTIPSVDPYNNSASLDFIPTNIIDNIIASKTFTPDQPGTFTGGNVNIKSKSFPEKETFKISLSTSYNSTNNLKKDFLYYEGGDYDFLGFGTNAREFPSEEFDIEPDLVGPSADIFARFGTIEGAAEKIDRLAKSLDYNFVPEEMTSPLNHGIGLSYGNNYKVGESQELGVLASVAYKRSFKSNNDFPINYWRVANESSEDLLNRGLYTTTRSSDNPEINTFVGLSYKVNNFNTLTLKNIYNHQAEKASRYLYGSDGFEIDANSSREKVGRANTFTEIGVNSTFLSGNHIIPTLGRLKIEWTTAIINTNRKEPNLDYFSSQRIKATGKESLPLASVSPPTMIWRDLHDFTSSSKIDITIPAKGFWNSEFAIGGLYTIKNRDFDEKVLNIYTSTSGGTPFEGDFDQFFSDDNLGQIGVDNNGKPIFGNFISDASKLVNNYTGESVIGAGYGMWVAKPSDLFRFVIGARYESTNMEVQSEIVNLEGVSPDETNTANINVGDILPAASLIFSLNENTNIRLNYAHTIARPNLREIAPFAAFDPLLNAYYLGNTQLKTSDIDNYDVRWEWFFQPGELFAVSAFYKSFTNPIAQTIKPAANTEFQFVNVDSGLVSGIELEVRKGLDIVLSGLKIGGNISFINSEMDIPENAVFQPEKRTFTGQSPILANLILSYSDYDNGLETSISYNYQGKRLSAIGNEAPDTYISPFNSLDFVVSKKISHFFDLKITVKNILNQDYEETVEYKGNEYIITEYPVGMTFGLGVSYSY